MIAQPNQLIVVKTEDQGFDFSMGEHITVGDLSYIIANLQYKLMMILKDGYKDILINPDETTQKGEPIEK